MGGHLQLGDSHYGSKSNSSDGVILAVPSVCFAAFADEVAAPHVQSFPFSFISIASQIGATAWFVSALQWVLPNVRSCRTVNSCQRSASSSSRSARASRAGRHIPLRCCSHIFIVLVHVQDFASVLWPTCLRFARRGRFCVKKFNLAQLTLHTS